MTDPQVVLVREADDPRAERARRAQRRARAAVEKVAQAERELAVAQAELTEVFGPDPRELAADQAVESFVRTVTGRIA